MKIPRGWEYTEFGFQRWQKPDPEAMLQVITFSNGGQIVVCTPARPMDSAFMAVLVQGHSISGHLPTPRQVEALLEPGEEKP